MTIPELIEYARFPFVDILKIDIEGAEVELFGDEAEWLERVGAIAIEFHGDSRERSGFDRIVLGHGFRIDDKNSHTVIAYRADWSRSSNIPNDESSSTCSVC